MSTEFIDDDLLKTQDLSIKSTDSRSYSSVRPISEAGLSRMMRQKEDMSNQMAGAVKEIEQLRMKQVDLEKEKIELEDLARRQDDYQKNKLEIVEKLTKSLILIEKEEVNAARMVELFSVMGMRFKASLSELQKIDEGSWTDDNYQMEISKAQVLVEDARNIYKKAMAKIDAAGWKADSMEAKTETASTGMLSDIKGPVDLITLLKIGFAVCLPLMVFFLIMFLWWLVAQGLIFGN